MAGFPFDAWTVEEGVAKAGAGRIAAAAIPAAPVRIVRRLSVEPRQDMALASKNLLRRAVKPMRFS
jgi:hypothetical protein